MSIPSQRRPIIPHYYHNRGSHWSYGYDVTDEVALRGTSATSVDVISTGELKGGVPVTVDRDSVSTDGVWEGRVFGEIAGSAQIELKYNLDNGDDLVRYINFTVENPSTK